MDKYRLLFSKTGRAVYISHLDLMRTLTRAFLRAECRLKYSEGFNPHPQISIALPLSVDVACNNGLHEEFRIDIHRENALIFRTHDHVTLAALDATVEVVCVILALQPREVGTTC